MSDIKLESIVLLVDLEEALRELLRATRAEDQRRRNRLAHLIERAHRIREAWDTRWQCIDALLSSKELDERRPPPH